jgi:hypothetical protein
MGEPRGKEKKRRENDKGVNNKMIDEQNRNSEKEEKLLKLNRELNSYYRMRSAKYNEIETLTFKIKRLESKINKIQDE